MPTDQLRIMVYRHSVFYSPLIAVVAAGFLEEEGLTATYFPKPPRRNQYEMFRNDEVDIMQAAVSTNWDPLSKGDRDIPVHFAQINQRDGFFLMRRGSRDAFEWRDLEGTRVLADHAQQPFAMFKYGLHLKGVNLNRIELSNAGSPDAMEKAFRDGQADYIHLQGPAPQQLEKEGVGKVVAVMGEVIPPVAFSSLMARREFLRTAKAQAFMRAYRRSLRFVLESSARDIATAEASFFPAIPVDVMEAAIARYQQLGTWRLDPTITREQYDMAMDIFVHAGIFKERFPYEDVVVRFA
ncbi:MAG: hypothetical protein DMG16_14180 [Acidobacteria bacterium]|nr:MAG: hypothetical protein DMG16_14180 [Acidobacteriota bacterium]